MAVPLEKLEGKYEILRKLNEGGMGAIYRVRHRLLGDERVVKIMRPTLETDASLRKRFEREARAASSLSHPNIAQLYDFTIDEEGFAFIVMEYIQGMTLEELIAREPKLPLGLALEIAQQSLGAIGHLHSQGMIHRDISPDNLMLTRDYGGRPQIKLIDLGIAKSMEKSEVGLTATGMFVGKLRYASPEQFHETGDTVSRRSDLYSFGLVLYEILTGIYPIVGEGPTSIIAGHLFRPPRDFAETDPEGRIPNALRHTVLKALAKKREERFDNAEALSAELDGLRRSGDIELPGVQDILALTLEEPRGDQATDQGTTQKRLDEYFTTGERTPIPKPAGPTAMLPDRDDPLAERVRDIEALLASDRLAEARQALDESRREAGADPRLADLGDRLHDRARTLHRDRVRQLVSQARAASDRNQPEQAVELLREGLELIPGDRQLAELLDDARRAVREKEDQARRATEIERRAQEISRQLAAGQLAEAERELSTAAGTFGRDPRLHTLQTRLEDLRSERQRQVDVLVREAEDLQRRQLYSDADAVIERALDIVPEDPDLLWRQAEIRGEIERQAAARSHDQALAHVKARIESSLERGQVEAAAKQLAAAEAALGDDATLLGLRRRIEEKGVAPVTPTTLRTPDAEPPQAAPPRAAVAPEDLSELKRSRADQLVGRAEVLSQSEDFSAAHRVVQEAVQLVPDHSAALMLSRSLQTLKHIEAQESDSLERRVEEIRKLLKEDNASAAMRRLNEAVEIFSDHPDLQALRYEIAEVFLDQSLSESDNVHARSLATEAPQTSQEAPPQVVQAVQAVPPQATPAAGGPPLYSPKDGDIRTGVAEVTLAGHLPEPEPPPPAPVQPAPAPSPVPPSTATPVSAAELGFGSFDNEPEENVAETGTAEEPMVPAQNAPASTGPDLSSPKVWLAAVILIALFMLLGMWLARSGGESTETIPPPPPVETEDISGPNL